MSEKTPKGQRKHVVILGKTNAGKSTLFNTLTGQERAITSPMPGTTTDPVAAAMELVPFGPVVLTDTAGLDDGSPLGHQRVTKTKMACRRADAALFAVDATAPGLEEYQEFLPEKLDHILVFTKCDGAGASTIARLKEAYPHALFLPAPDGAEDLRSRLAALLESQTPEDAPLVGDLLPPGSHVVLVTPIDSEAPKGRLILPQVQVLRDCLDHGMQCTVCRELELENALANMKSVDLVVTDSQAFGYVSARLPTHLPLTSFSMLLARQKGNFAQLLSGVNGVASLREGDRVLMLEGCTHNHTHEDIGRTKIPNLLHLRLGIHLTFDYACGYDFPEDLSPYAMAVQCGGCMLNRREITARLERMDQAGLPVTNYGILLAWGTGILERSCQIFREAAP